jgi:hypothetical protein
MHGGQDILAQKIEMAESTAKIFIPVPYCISQFTSGSPRALARYSDDVARKARRTVQIALHGN